MENNNEESEIKRQERIKERHKERENISRK